MAAAEGKLEVIRKLLAKAEHAGTAAEAEAFNAKATELMARDGMTRRCWPPPGSSGTRSVTVGSR